MGKDYQQLCSQKCHQFHPHPVEENIQYNKCPEEALHNWSGHTQLNLWAADNFTTTDILFLSLITYNAISPAGLKITLPI